VIAAGDGDPAPSPPAHRQKRRIEEVLHAIDAGDLVAGVIRQDDFEALFEAIKGLAGDDPAARPAAARIPPQPARPRVGGGARADRGGG
jgi:hypothetical protein